VAVLFEKAVKIVFFVFSPNITLKCCIYDKQRGKADKHKKMFKMIAKLLPTISPNEYLSINNYKYDSYILQ